MSAAKPPALSSALVIIEILRAIPRRRFVTAREIQAHLEAAGMARDLRSVQRLLDDISLHFPIERDTREKPYGYRWMEHAQGLRLPLLTTDEALLLRLAFEHVRELLPTALIRRLAPVLESARLELQAPTAAQAKRWLKKVCRVDASQPLLPAKFDPGIWVAISEGLYLEHKLAIVYRNARGKPVEAVIWPLGLVQQGPRLYLVARFEGYDNERILALPRIRSVRLLGERFIYPAGFDLSAYAAEGHFGIRQGERVRLAFRIAKATGWHLTESPLSADQTVTEHEDCLEITATVVDSKLLDMWLRGFGEEVWAVVKQPIDADRSNLGRFL